MKITRFQQGELVAFGNLRDDGNIEYLSGSPFEGNVHLTGEFVALDSVKVLSPVARPRIFGAGFNYVSHIKETGWDIPTRPALFVKPESALAGPNDPIVYPSAGEVVHYEAELVVVIGRTARRVSEADALNYVLGYTCGNDVSERVIQKEEMAFGCLFAGKAFDTFAPLGPVINTELDPSNLNIIGRLNGEVVQNGNTSDLLFSVPYLVAYLSSFMTLEPGDVIMTGTPSGIGTIKPGDVFEVEIEGIGVLSNPVIADR
ncbi:fumarylacetoacetate hydrolase family protein [Paraburkholderia sp. RL17-337-BIB-A]|jgi:2-keto-4-pentenoate hydratase/2-oxohepta-3-ene-1,7-dioic acid hydratase in catechol pathway|uniref:fumarylacetoacetate hydrolase family protein n=1 Tax=Paraburkholderia sp. RL17-337-BIB-A TaxID=3031636 RepID=UPI0038BC5DE5